jgi:hypothetical protein
MERSFRARIPRNLRAYLVRFAQMDARQTSEMSFSKGAHIWFPIQVNGGMNGA